MTENIRFAKEELGIEEIIGRHARGISASKNVLKKLGFQYVKDISHARNEGTKIYQGKEYILKF